MRKQKLCEHHNAITRFGFSIIHGRDHADESAICPVARDGVHYHPELARVFAGNNPAVALIPIKNQFLILVPLDHVFVDYNLAPTGNGDRSVSEMNRLPAGPRQAIFWRMNGVSRPLAGVVPDIKLNGHVSPLEIDAIRVVADAHGLHGTRW